MKTIVKKYGGATLADPQKIKQVAQTLHACHQRGEKLIVVVSAMGQTTNELIALAGQVSSKPKRRELDMLLTTGERISMSLLSLALNDLHCPAISFTGSQAGVLTDDSHSNAFITAINSPRVVEALQRHQVVIIAGFQGVSPKTKEVTTLGRGGSDTTAVAMAAALKANHCEILKDVPGVFTADPKICTSAKPISHLSYQQLLEMTFWGAKVLHYRSVELAYRRRVPLYIGPAHHTQTGTWVFGEMVPCTKTKSASKPELTSSSKREALAAFSPPTLASKSSLKNKEPIMFEAVSILSLNSHADVLKLTLRGISLSDGLKKLQDELNSKEIPFPQLLATESTTLASPPAPPSTNSMDIRSVQNNSSSPTEEHLYVTGPQEVLSAIKKEVKIFSFAIDSFCTITATCTGVSTPEIASLITQKLIACEIQPLRLWMSGMSCTLLLPAPHRQAALTELHSLIQE